MVSRQAKVINETGIHARPASNLINLAKQYTSKITIRNISRANTPAVNAKSIVMVLTLAVSKGMEVEIVADGADEQQAVDSMIGFIEAGLGEASV